MSSPELCNDERKVGAHEGLGKYQLSEDVLVHQLYCDTKLLDVLTLLLCVEGGRVVSEKKRGDGEVGGMKRRGRYTHRGGGRQRGEEGKIPQTGLNEKT